MPDHQTSQTPTPRAPGASASARGGSVAAFAALEQWLCACLIEREGAVHAALLALVAREHLLLVGPPGTARSLLVTLLARASVDPTGQPLPTCSDLMSRFTTLEDLFGPISLPRLNQKRYVRITQGRLAEAKLAFLDKVLLTLMNERLFDNDGARLPVPLHSLCGATNTVNLPQNPEGKTGQFPEAADPAHHPGPADATAGPGERPAGPAAATQPGTGAPGGLPDLAAHPRDPARAGITISDRRWQQSVSVLLARVLLAGRASVALEDLRILRLVLWQKLEQQGEIARLLIGLVSPCESEILEIEDQAESALAAHREARQDASLAPAARRSTAHHAGPGRRAAYTRTTGPRRTGA